MQACSHNVSRCTNQSNPPFDSAVHFPWLSHTCICSILDVNPPLSSPLCPVYRLLTTPLALVLHLAVEWLHRSSPPHQPTAALHSGTPSDYHPDPYAQKVHVHLKFSTPARSETGVSTLRNWTGYSRTVLLRGRSEGAGGAESLTSLHKLVSPSASCV